MLDLGGSEVGKRDFPVNKLPWLYSFPRIPSLPCQIRFQSNWAFLTSPHFSRAVQLEQDRPPDPSVCSGRGQCGPGVQLLPGQSQPLQRQVVQGAPRVLQVHAARVSPCQGLPSEGNENKCEYQAVWSTLIGPGMSRQGGGGASKIPPNNGGILRSKFLDLILDIEVDQSGIKVVAT